MSQAWFVYVLSSRRSGRTYVGISTDPLRRLAQHNGERPGGARTTRAGRPWRIAARYGPFGDRSEALRVERAVKRLRGPRRLAWRPPAPAKRRAPEPSRC
jgi:putative endonuclease